MAYASFEEDVQSLEDEVGRHFAKELVVGSSIDPQVALERPYQLVDKIGLLNLGFDPRGYDQALMIPLRSPDLTTVVPQIKPIIDYDSEKRRYPYRFRKNEQMIVDFHPRSLKLLDDINNTLWITEGAKKGDSLVSRGLCAASIPGVSTFAKKGSSYKELLDCWNHIPLEDRKVVIVYDCDSQSNPDVQHALSELVKRLEERGSRVKIVYLPPVNKDPKAGVDDYLASGKTLEDLEDLITDFYPINIAEKKLQRDSKFRDLIMNCWATLSRIQWKGKGGVTDRAVYEFLILESAKKEWVVEDGVKLQISYRYIAENTGLHLDTVFNSIQRLINQHHLIELDNRDRGRSSTNRYILLSYSDSTPVQGGPKRGDILGSSYLPLPMVRDYRHLTLRNSTPSRKPKSGLVKDTRKVRDISVGYERDGVKRLGKKIEYWIKVLLERGADQEQILIRDLAVYLNLKNVRQLKKDLQAEKGLFVVDSLVGKSDLYMKFIGKDTDAVKLNPAWEVNLKQIKEITGEKQSEEGQQKLYTRDRKKYNDWLNQQSESESGDEIDIINEVIKAKQESKTEDPAEPTGEDLREAVIEMLEEIEDLIMIG